MWIFFVVIILLAFPLHQNSAFAFDVTPKQIEDHQRQSSENLTCNGGHSSTIFAIKDSCELIQKCSKPVDCADISEMGFVKSGVYRIWPKNKIINDRSIKVFCDMDTDNGGWIVIQRRGNFLRPNDYFYKDWANYKTGFGDIERDFWLGNDNIFALTNQKLYSARFDLTDVEGNHRYALYDIFFTDDEKNKYKLTIQDYSGTANDSMIEWHSGRNFSTKDQDNDSYPESCAVKFKGGWWYDACHASNLNGLYLRGKHESYADGVVWSLWKGHHESMDKTEIKIRPKDFHKTFLK